ncbi:MAG: YjbH domain-containing protein [Ignavibacteria bacterium]|nr:YjbH domain-containing protein [Ignavibacteria bacterium]
MKSDDDEGFTLRARCMARVITLALIATLQGSLFAQGSAGSEGGLEPRSLVDIPTAGMLAKGTFGFDIDFFQEGGVLVGFTAGVLDRLTIGLSYGGSRIIGSSTPVMNNVPGFTIKIRVLEENMALPAIALGFDTQGKEGYLKDLKRYGIKSPGFYVVGSKNYSLLGYLSFHGGLNYSLENSDGDKDINVFAGLEKTLGPFLSLIVEYNLARNDSNDRAVGRGRGYFNTGLKCTLGGGLTLGVMLKDLAKNGKDVDVGNRTVSVEYVNFF